jgi:hypothetical protein
MSAPEWDEQLGPDYEVVGPGDGPASLGESGLLFIPAHQVRIRRCPVCQDDYLSARLAEHIAQEHQEQKRPVQERPKSASVHPASASAPAHPAYVRPASVPVPVDTAKVRPLRPEAEAEGVSRSMRPEPDSTPPARVPRRRGGPRSKPKPR